MKMWCNQIFVVYWILNYSTTHRFNHVTIIMIETDFFALLAIRCVSRVTSCR